MKQDPEISEIQNVMRTAMVVKRKQPFYDWLKNIEKNSNFSHAVEADVYLLPDFEEIGEMENWIKKHFDRIFCDQLLGWYSNETLWVKNRTFKMFQEWFDYSMHTMVWDVVEDPIDKLG